MRGVLAACARVGLGGVCVIVLAGAGAAAGGATVPGKMIVGVDDDTARWLARPDGLVAAQRTLGLDAVRITLPWRRGQVIPSRTQQVWLRRIALTVTLGQRVVLAVDGRAAQAPTYARSRHQYCRFVAHVVRRIPIRDVVIWNEANNPTFWPSGGAASYERLLATCWDALHAARPDVNVIDSTAPHENPAAFISALGAAFRTSLRQRPILDTFGHNVYPEDSSEPVWATHQNGSIDEGDYAQLVDVLTDAFAATPQPVPGEGTTRIWYLEDGFQTAPSPEKRHLYVGNETDAAPLSAASSDSLAAAPDQGTQLRAAIELAYCQPDVGAFFNFELMDERSLSGWQSGLLWPDGTAKPVDESVRDAVTEVSAGSVDCTSTAQG